MSGVQFGITIAACTAATMLTRFLPFLIFSSKDQQPPEVVRYLGRVLPAAIFGMLIIYCLKGVSVFTGSHGIPEAIAIGVTIALHKWKHETLVSIAGGTLCYVLLVQPIPTLLPPLPAGNILLWLTTTTSWLPTPCTPWAGPSWT